MEDFKGAVYYPNTFKEGIQKEVIAICKVFFEKEISKSKPVDRFYLNSNEFILFDMI